MHSRSAIAIAVAVLTLGVAQSASAHVTAQSSAADGADQTDITLSSPAERAFLTAADARVERRDDDHYRLAVHTQQPTVDIRVLSRDGHVTQIRLDRTQPAAPIVSTRSVRDPALQVLGRLLVLCALIAMAGSLVVARWIIVPGNRNPLRMLGQAAVPPDPGVELRLAATVARTWTIGAVVGGLGIACGLTSVLRRLQSGDLVTLLTQTRFGHATLVSAAALVVCGAVARRPHFGVERTSALVGAAASVGALIAVSVAGHATAGRDAVLSGGFDAAHMLATAIWIGGLVSLLAAWGAVRRSAATGAAARLGAIVVRFSGVAVACVATLAVTGTYRALAELGSFGDLVHTAYGRALAVKLLLFAVLLGVGAFNRFVVHPRLERAGIGLADSDRGAVGLLGPSVRIELTLAAAVLVAVAIMIGFPPPG